MQQLKCLLLIRIQNDTPILEKLLFLTFKHTSSMQHMSPYSLWNRDYLGHILVKADTTVLRKTVGTCAIFEALAEISMLKLPSLFHWRKQCQHKYIKEIHSTVVFHI